MPQYHYIAKNQAGEVKQGEVEGKDERSAVESLRSNGLFVTSIVGQARIEEKKIGFTFFSRVSLSEKMMFARHLGVMLSSGLSLPKALIILASQSKSPKMRQALLDTESEVKGGKSLAESLETKGVLDDLSINMMKVGEVGGNMQEVLELLAEQLEKEHNLIAKVKGAMYYPTIIFIVMISIGIAMMIYVVPSITSLFKDMDVELPVTTKMIIVTSDFMKNNQLLVVAIFVALIALIFFLFRLKAGKKLLSWLAIKVPAIKNISIKTNNARFARIYASLTKSGVSVVETLGIISRTLTNQYYRNAFSEIKEEVQKGKLLNDELRKYPELFPVLAVQMVQVGEETGKTIEVLLDLAKFYETEIDQMTKNLSSIIEPILMVVIGAAVGFFAVSMIMPMYSVMENM